LLTGLESTTAAIQYWAAIGLRTRGDLLDRGQLGQLSDSLPELSPAAAIVVADVLATFGDDEQAKQAFDVLLHFANFENANAFYAVQALNVIDRTIDRMNSVAPTTLQQLKRLPVNDGLKRGGGYLKRLKQDIMSRNTAIEP
jgi:hypothetical protein